MGETTHIFSETNWPFCPCLRAGYIECDAPNENLYKFDGSLTLEQDQTVQVSLDINQVLPRVRPLLSPARVKHLTNNAYPFDVGQGSVLRNTAWIVGVALYTGQETKYMLSTTYAMPQYSKDHSERKGEQNP